MTVRKKYLQQFLWGNMVVKKKKNLTQWIQIIWPVDELQGRIQWIVSLLHLLRSWSAHLGSTERKSDTMNTVWFSLMFSLVSLVQSSIWISNRICRYHLSQEPCLFQTRYNKNVKRYYRCTVFKVLMSHYISFSQSLFQFMLKLYDGAEFKATPNSFGHAFMELAFCTGMCMYEHVFIYDHGLNNVDSCQKMSVFIVTQSCYKMCKRTKGSEATACSQCCVSYDELFKQHPGNFQLDETESTKGFQF